MISAGSLCGVWCNYQLRDPRILRRHFKLSSNRRHPQIFANTVWLVLLLCQFAPSELSIKWTQLLISLYSWEYSLLVIVKQANFLLCVHYIQKKLFLSFDNIWMDNQWQKAFSSNSLGACKSWYDNDERLWILEGHANRAVHTHR